jgi:hypothetical protein
LFKKYLAVITTGIVIAVNVKPAAAAYGKDVIDERSVNTVWNK